MLPVPNLIQYAPSFIGTWPQEYFLNLLLKSLYFGPATDNPFGSSHFIVCIVVTLKTNGGSKPQILLWRCRQLSCL